MQLCNLHKSIVNVNYKVALYILIKFNKDIVSL